MPPGLGVACDAVLSLSNKEYLYMKYAVGPALALALISTPVLAQSSYGTWNDLPDRFQVDTGYFRLSPSSLLRYNPESGEGGEVDLERDLGFDDNASTFWLDGTWRLGRRHQIKLSYTWLNRDALDHEIQRDFEWGGETYNAGLTANSEAGADLLGGYYRFALVRNDRFEIGPAVGIGYLWLDVRVRATGTVTGPGGMESRSLDEAASTSSITGAIGGYGSAWATERLLLQGDFLYIKVTPENKEASVTDWRLGANYYFFRNAGLGVQYKYYRYSYDRGIVSQELGGEITYKGFQVYLSFRF
jgi:hypothetical protein